MCCRSHISAHPVTFLIVKARDPSVPIQTNIRVVRAPFDIIKIFTRRKGDRINLVAMNRITVPDRNIRILRQIERVLRNVKRCLNRRGSRGDGRLTGDGDHAVRDRRCQMICQRIPCQNIGLQGQRILCSDSRIRRDLKPDRDRALPKYICIGGVDLMPLRIQENIMKLPNRPGKA